MDKIKVPPALRNEARQFLELKEKASEATSLLNRQTTVLRNALKADLDTNHAPPGSFYVMDGYRFAVEASVTNGIDPDHLMKEYEQGRITREQFLSCVKVQLEDTRLHLGGDVVEALSQPMVGSRVDVRARKLSVEEEAAIKGTNVLVVADEPKVKRKTRTQSKLDPAARKTTGTVKRRIKTTK